MRPNLLLACHYISGEPVFVRDVVDGGLLVHGGAASSGHCSHTGVFVSYDEYTYHGGSV